jgi:hypothetical protein
LDPGKRKMSNRRGKMAIPHNWAKRYHGDTDEGARQVLSKDRERFNKLVGDGEENGEEDGKELRSVTR